MSAFERAKHKLESGTVPFNLTNLPRDVNNSRWNQIEERFELSLEEVLTLQNSLEQPPQNGKIFVFNLLLEYGSGHQVSFPSNVALFVTALNRDMMILVMKREGL
jgi:glutaredoxin 2